jgi:hypothetical protein
MPYANASGQRFFQDTGGLAGAADVVNLPHAHAANLAHPEAVNDAIAEPPSRL